MRSGSAVGYEKKERRRLSPSGMGHYGQKGKKKNMATTLLLLRTGNIDIQKERGRPSITLLGRNKKKLLSVFHVDVGRKNRTFPTILGRKKREAWGVQRKKASRQR